MKLDIQCALRAASTHLSYSSSPQLDSELLLAKVLHTDRVSLYVRHKELLSSRHLHDFYTLLEKRRCGYPLAYILGYKEFWSLPLEVNEYALIPRAETEHLVEQALSCLPPASDKTLQILDLGTGSGAVAIALASERSDCVVTASDYSIEALRLARKNADSLGLTNIEFVQCSWLEGLPMAHYNIIVSNPPYIATTEKEQLMAELQYEPALALFAGDDGLSALRQISCYAAAHLRPQGSLLLEHGVAQAATIKKILRQDHWQQIAHFCDYAGNRRIIGACKGESGVK